ncbi:MAG: fibronectin type III domain-containing protein [Oscillospiraceae bacterium]|nr:fibronectin type III domain-containing protein [Oscillospiraceae bacterium]
MSDLKMISPLLDGMQVEKESPAHKGRKSYILRRDSSDDRFVLKVLSVPAADSQVRAMILSGAYPDEAAVHEYYGRVVSNIKAELDAGKKLAESGFFSGALDYQIEPKESGVGFDVYILRPFHIPLNELISHGAITNLRAINLGIDLCDSVNACRSAGYIFGNIKPENVFLTHSGRFMLGDLGLIPLEDLEYACLPEEYLGAYSAPELSEITSAPNRTMDIYSLGMVLYKIYNGNHDPFEDENTVEGMADRLRMTGKPLPTPIYADYELAGIILKACAFNPEDRYQSPDELKQAICMYMQRNEISDTLIVPPIVADEAPIAPDAEETEPTDEPIRMTDADQLDDDFRKSFAPDLSGAGTEKDIDKTIAIPVVTPTEPRVEPQPEPAEAAQEPEPITEPAPETAAAQPQNGSGAPAAEESEEAEADEDFDPDQINLDELLASVERVVNKELPEPETEIPTAETALKATEDAAPVSDEYVDGAKEPEEEEAEEEAPRRSGRVGKVFLIIGLLLAIAAVGWFLWQWFFVHASAVNVLACNTEEMIIELVTNDTQDKFVVTCTDSYGNAYPVDVVANRYTFSGLSEKTTYTITVEAAPYHMLTPASVTTLTRTTPEATRIVDFTAKRGDEDGEVLLSFLHEGPTPSHWILSYTNADGSSAKSFDFDGNAFLVTGLTQGESYTFTLEAAGDVFLSGTTTVEYELLPFVEANDLDIVDIDGSNLHIQWTAGKNLPEKWTIVCESGDFRQEGTSQETAFTITGLPDFARDYTISVSARGMDKPETLVLPANPIVVDNLKATANDDGTVTLAWETPAGAPSGGWYVTYNAVGSFHTEYLPDAENNAVSGNSTVLNSLIPNTEYSISIATTAADASSRVFGETTTGVKTAAAQNFKDYGINPDAPLPVDGGYVTLWTVPETADWKYTDLTDKKNAFSASDKIAVCLEVKSVNASEDSIRLTYVIRDAEGHAVTDAVKTMAWNDMWYSRRHASAIPMPEKDGAVVTGSYTLEIYVNGKLLASAAFTIS